MPEAVMPAAFSFPKIKNYAAASVKRNTKNKLETAAGEDFPADSATVSTVPATSSRTSLYFSPVRIEEQLLMEQSYASNTPSYNPAEAVGKDIHSKDKDIHSKDAGAEAGYALSVDQDSEVLDAREAEDTFKKIQYAAITGNTSDVSPDERRKFNLWVKFNPALSKMLETMYALTRDVNYGT